MNESYVHSFSAMGTVVSIQVVGHGANDHQRADRQSAVERATEWFLDIERTCTRFDPSSELSRLSTRVGEAVPASAMLFEAVRFALAVARESDGAFDPTMGRSMESLGFDREHRTGEPVRSAAVVATGATWRDVVVDEDDRTITVRRPLVLDLGAVAKGLAIDMAARELAPFVNFAVDAGGDLYLGGCNASGEPWSVGIRHPREPELIERVFVSDIAVCTSGDYERIGRAGGDEPGHHILDPQTRRSSAAAASVTVLAPAAMVADALATAAFVLGPARGLALLERHGVDGLIVTPDLERFTTPGMRSDYKAGHAHER